MTSTDLARLLGWPPPSNTLVVDIGALEMPTGRVYCCDPFLSNEVDVLEQQVPPGRYRVQLVLVDTATWGQRVAVAVLRFSEAPITAWRDATWRAHDEQHASFPVEAGMGCFMDASTREVLVDVKARWHAAGDGANYFVDRLFPEVLRQRASQAAELTIDINVHHPVEGDPRNVVMFPSGFGDGVYTARWGLDAAGVPVLLVADFDVFSRAHA